MRREGVDFSRVREVRVGISELTVAAVSKSRPPTTGNEARFHLEYCVALAALGEDVILPEHSIEFETFLAKPQVRALLGKVRVVADPAQKHYHHCAVTLIDGQGLELARREGRGPKGSPQNPMTDDEVLGKFRRLVSHRLSGVALDEYLAKARQLERHPHWGWLVGAFA
jgi:2-methylcitrate dehydratase PrpD